MIGIQGNFNKMPMPIPQSIPQPSEQEEMIEEQNIENINGQDYITEILNISKVKEGFYIGDKIAAISIEVVVQFKLTHMINASGNQIINQWETIGMKYLTLNWAESPNQLLFDPNDEIADKILFFVDDSFINGEGLLAHSFKGQNRVCIVVLIYLMKKYRWSLKKSMEYLKSKKQDVDIPPYFLSQLIKFESRLIQRGELTKDIPWSFENLKDPEEKLLRNTYINGINKSNKNEEYINYNKSNRHILWADSNPYQQLPISVIDLDKDLFFKNNIKPIFVHQQNKILKPCIKNKNKNKIDQNNIQKDNEEKEIIQNNINNNFINNLINRNIINNNNFIIANNKNINKNIKNDEDLIEENNKQTNNNILNKNDINININNNNKKGFINKKMIKNENINNYKYNNEDEDEDENININIPYKNNMIDNNNIPNKKAIIKKNIPNKKAIINNNIPNKNDIINNNFIINNNNVLKMVNDNQLKKNIKRNINENQQYEGQINQNNFFINSYNLNNNNNNEYNENIQPNIKVKNDFNNDDDEENQINNINKFAPNEIINYKIYEEKDNNTNNKLSKISKKRVGYTTNPERNNIKEENIIIITNKCDNIIKNNINNYYINQIGTINNNVNNNINNNNNNDLNNNYNYENNKNKQNNNDNNNKDSNINNMNKSKKNNKMNFNNIGNNIENINNINNNKKENNKHIKKNNKNINNENIQRENDFEEMIPDINIKELTRPFNNSKILKNNFKNVLGNNHKQILGINNNNDNNNYYFIGQNYNTANNINSSITPKNTKSAKLITNLSNNLNGKRFKIIDNTNINNYNTSNNNSHKKKNHNPNHHHSNNSKSNNHKENKTRHNHNYNVIINTRKDFDNIQTSPNQFLGRTSPKNNNNNNYKYDPIISNYNPIKKNKNNNRIITSNSKNKNYQNNDNYENNSNINNVNVNNYNTSSNKPLNNFNPNLIKRKGTPTAGHQTIKINNINNNPVKIKNNIFINNKKPSTPDMIINKSSTMVNNNSYIGPKINNANNIFYNMNKNAHFNNNLIHKSKKLKNYNNMQRPATAPHKDKPSKEKRGAQIIHHIHESKKGINNYNKNANKANQRPASAGQGQGKHNHKEKDKIENIYKYSDNNINGFNVGKKIEIEFGSKYKNSFQRKRVASPQLSINNNKMNLGNNYNNKINAAKFRLPSPMIKSTNLNGKTIMNSINKSNTNYYMNKSASFNIK